MRDSQRRLVGHARFCKSRAPIAWCLCSGPARSVSATDRIARAVQVAADDWTRAVPRPPVVGGAEVATHVFECVDLFRRGTKEGADRLLARPAQHQAAAQTGLVRRDDVHGHVDRAEVIAEVARRLRFDCVAIVDGDAGFEAQDMCRLARR